MPITTSPFRASRYISSPEDEEAYLQVAFESGDAEHIAKALLNVAEARGLADLARQAGVDRDAIYAAEGSDRDTAAELLKIVHALGYDVRLGAPKPEAAE